MSASAAALLRERRILVCVGCGGVGKTTVSAALALEAARAGRRALVLTIDPARRLADALGLSEIGNEPRAIAPELLSRLGVPPEGGLSAVMLDMKRTFDDLVERFAEDPQSRDRILENPIYRHVSDALAGSVEYSAMEKVYQIATQGDYDLIVVDTPPAQHALDFLEAPQRLLEFLDSRLVQLLIHPAFAASRFGVRLFQRSTHRVFRLIEQITGMGFLEDVSEFLLAFEGMSDGFRRRAGEVRALLQGGDAAYVLVAGPERESVLQSQQFLDRLEAFGVHLAGLVANRVRTWPEATVPPDLAPTEQDAKRLAEGLGSDDAAQAALRCVGGYAALVRRDERALRELRTRIESGGRFWCAVPEQDRDVHDLEALSRMGEIIGREARSGEDGP